MAVTFTRQSPTWADGHTVFAEDAERWESLGADTASWSAGVDTALHWRPLVRGRWHPASIPFSACNATIALSASTVEMLPFIVTAPMTFDMIGTFVGTASGTVIRFGVYDNDPALDEPGALVHDQGTTSSATTGDKTLTITGNLALSAGLYWLAMVSDGSPAVRRTAGTLYSRGHFAVFGSPGVDLPEGYSLRYTGYDATAALPDPATRAGRSSRALDIPLLWLRRTP